MAANVCIIGCGDRGRVHAKAWAATPDVRITAVCDIDASRAAAFAAETGATAFADWREAILQEGVTVVSQCVPSCLHADITCFAAEHGRHVFGEKPLALTLADGERMLRTLKATGTVFMPCFQCRDRWAFRAYREAFAAGEFGGPVVLRYADVREVRPKVAMHRESRNGGPVVDMACHLIDGMRWITSTEPVRVYATGRVFGRGKARLAGVPDLAVDEACVEVTYQGGHQLQLYLNWGMPEGYPGHSDEMLVGPSQLMRPAGRGLDVWRGPEVRKLEAPTTGAEPGVSVRIARLLDAVAGRAPVDIGAEDGMAALRVSRAALESARTGQPVNLPG